MNGQTMNYNHYFEALQTMPQPVSFVELSKVQMDFRGILKYAKEHNINPNELTMEEREQYCKKGMRKCVM